MQFYLLPAAVVILSPLPLHGQGGAESIQSVRSIRSVVFVEDFDSLDPPTLPPEWSSSDNRAAGTNDFTTVASSPLSEPNALISTNATVDQFVLSPPVSFQETSPDSILFWTRRSSSHGAEVVIEASIDNGLTFPIHLGDTLRNTGTTDYVRAACAIPDTLAGVKSIRFRWRVIAGPSGSTGTFRIDDVAVTAKSQDDLQISRVSISPASPGTTDPLVLTCHLLNTGLRTMQGTELMVYLDGDRDTTAAPGELVASMSTSTFIQPGDSLAIAFPLPPLQAGLQILIAVSNNAGDDNPLNDTLVVALRIRHPAHTLVVNEILFEPRSGGSEYLEITNTGSTAVDLHEWMVRDRPGTSGTANEFVLADSTFHLPPDGFVLLAEDSTILLSFPFLAEEPGILLRMTGGEITLNNDGDDIVLVDPSGVVIDSVAYLPSWHHPEVNDPSGRSLEKIHPALNGEDRRSWSTSAAPVGGTPGRQNSLYASTPPPGSSLKISPNPFSPDGDGRDDVAVIHYEAPEGGSTISLRIFDIDGRLIRQLATGEITGPTGNIVWDGLDDQRRKARIGMYVVFLEIVDTGGVLLGTRKAVVVLAGKL